MYTCIFFLSIRLKYIPDYICAQESFKRHKKSFYESIQNRNTFKMHAHSFLYAFIKVFCIKNHTLIIQKVVHTLSTK